MTDAPERSNRPRSRAAAFAASVLVGALDPVMTACGGSSSGHTTSTPTASAAPPPAVHATLTAPTDTPKVNTPWHDVVRVTNAGNPVAALVHLKALVHGVAVGQTVTINDPLQVSPA